MCIWPYCNGMNACCFVRACLWCVYICVWVSVCLIIWSDCKNDHVGNNWFKTRFNWLHYSFISTFFFSFFWFFFLYSKISPTSSLLFCKKRFVIFCWKITYFVYLVDFWMKISILFIHNWWWWSNFSPRAIYFFRQNDIYNC